MLLAAPLAHCGRFYRRSTAKMCFQLQAPKIPPGARSLCNYRCKLGVCGKLPDFLPPLPVNNTLPTTFRYLSWFCDLMPVSCGVKRVNVQMKVTVLPKLFRVKYMINFKRRTMSCCGMHRRWEPRVKSKVLIFLCSSVSICSLAQQFKNI